MSHVDRVCSPVEFPYRPADVQRWWNCHRDPNIDRADAGRLAYWLNAVVLNRIAAYLAAVDAARVTSCSGPGDCPALIRRVFTERGVGVSGGGSGESRSVRVGFQPPRLQPVVWCVWPVSASEFAVPGPSCWSWCARCVTVRPLREHGGRGEHGGGVRLVSVGVPPVKLFA